MTSVIERLQSRAAGFSVEFFPPRDAADEAVLWRSIRELEPLDPAYVSITYGAGGSSRQGTIRSIARVATETTLVPMAHLTAVNHSVAELRHVIGSYAAVGVRNILALRGDPPGDPYGEWVPHPHGLRYAEELVTLVRSLGDFCVGVSAFPYGHPRSPDLATDTAHLVRKFAAGADFAIAQLFFEAEDFLRLRDRVCAAGCDKPIIPGIMPLTTPRTLAKTIELSAAEPPRWLVDRLRPLSDDPKSFRAAGLDVVTELCERLLAEGVPVLHFYTFNRSKATRELVNRLGLVRVGA
ncbi:methylenetetrahydrofolate reductase (NADPH) [Saccharomonospora amisosensis]|uniref:Methylenetetrahydrofolate reductase n=1 Tax=Saccharomonospora amisosensis TaxID=1128677 RepID=A0A7X5UNC3_9PSEU|nr:methylenetetrahydrofolate reductase [NAD(P)H] [Saccharomonospora amisosensis]NIJ11191.1 methylenetetrahydrofolate reductase (NADPH) [Saccharomonospora amisosensis]